MQKLLKSPFLGTMAAVVAGLTFYHVLDVETKVRQATGRV